MNSDFRKIPIAVIGLGLMGGSFARRLKELGHPVIGLNRTKKVAEEALAMGIVDSIDPKDLKKAEIVIFCTPERGTLSFIKEHLSLLHEKAVLTDIAGVKSGFAQEVAALLPEGMDFVSGHHGAIPGSAMRSPGQFDHPLVARAKCEIATAALGNGVVPTHNVTTELKDLDVIRNDALRARNEFGFLRMWSIHPNQIVPIVEAMRPDFSEVEKAVAIVIAAQDKDWAPIAHEGLLHDRASYRYYWELLARAHATGMALPAEALQRFF